MDRPRDPTGAERQKRWRDRRRAASLPLRPQTEQPASATESLRDLLLAYIAADAAAPDDGGLLNDGETPEQLSDRLMAELETALYGFVHSWGFDFPSGDSAAEAARLRLMERLSAIMPIPTREELRRREEAALAAKKAEQRARRAAARQKARGTGGDPLRA